MRLDLAAPQPPQGAGSIPARLVSPTCRDAGGIYSSSQCSNRPRAPPCPPKGGGKASLFAARAGGTLALNEGGEPPIPPLAVARVKCKHPNPPTSPCKPPSPARAHPVKSECLAAPIIRKGRSPSCASTRPAAPLLRIHPGAHPILCQHHPGKGASKPPTLPPKRSLRGGGHPGTSRRANRIGGPAVRPKLLWGPTSYTVPQNPRFRHAGKVPGRPPPTPFTPPAPAKPSACRPPRL